MTEALSSNFREMEQCGMFDARTADGTRPATQEPDLLKLLALGEAKIGLMMLASSRRFARGSTLIAPDSQHEFVYRVRKGWLYRTRVLADGRNQCIMIYLPGDLVAITTMFRLAHPDTISAASDVMVEKVRSRELCRLFMQDREVSIRCIWEIMEQERRLQNWIVSLGQGSAEERLSLLLIDLKSRLTAAAEIAPGAAAFEMPLTQSQLGAHLGLTAVHVNRVLKKLKHLGVLEIRAGTVTIFDPDALLRHAAPLLNLHHRPAPGYRSDRSAHIQSL